MDYLIIFLSAAVIGYCIAELKDLWHHRKDKH